MMIRTQLSAGLPTHSFVRAGNGLHSGARCKALVSPGQVGSGIRFVRNDVPGRPAIPARHTRIVSSNRSTTLGLGAGEVGMVEHLSAAFLMAGLWDAEVQVTGPEVPVLDGSAAPWVEALKSADLWAPTFPPARWYSLAKVVELSGQSWSARFEPAEEAHLTMKVSYNHPGVGSQSLALALQGDILAREIAPARTFGFMQDATRLSDEGLIQGADLSCALVYDEEGQVLNEGGLRFKDEVVRHKMLDFLGDMTLLGAPLMAKMTLEGTGHLAHRQILWGLVESRALVEHGPIWPR